jgi:hypothetical protein
MKKKQAEGFGDTIKQFTDVTGISKMFENKDCGCDRRRRTLNDIFPYKNK